MPEHCGNMWQKTGAGVSCLRLVIDHENPVKTNITKNTGIQSAGPLLGCTLTKYSQDHSLGAHLQTTEIQSAGPLLGCILTKYRKYNQQDHSLDAYLQTTEVQSAGPLLGCILAKYQMTGENQLLQSYEEA